ncbi:TPM domain-containing protein [Longibacter salinarum]|nr:TPM domain-containing protein [Longibacter salinarum]
MRFVSLRHFALLFALLFVAGTSSVAAQSVPEESIPELTGRVVDSADMLAPTTEQVITRQLKQLEDSTGNQVAVLTVESLDGYAIEDYSLAVARAWQLGTSDFDNGVLITVAKQERRMRIEVGFGLEGQLPDATADRIIRHEMRPRFRDGDFDTGVRAGVTAVVQSIEGTYEPPETTSDGVPPRVGGLFALILGAVFGVLPAYLLLTGTAKNGLGCMLIGILFLGFIPLVGTVAFFSGLGLVLFGESVFAFLFPLIGVPVALIAFIWHLVLILRSDDVQEMRDKFQEGETIKRDLKVGWLHLPASMWTKSTVVTSSGGGFSSGGFSSGGGGFSSSVGGFSGGGGSFGGGGASGSW